MSAGNQIVKQMDGCFRYLRLVEEFNHQWQVDSEPEHVIRVNLPIRAKPGDPSEDRDPLHGVPVVQNREDLPHQGSAPSVIRFAQIDSNHQDVIRQFVTPTHKFRARYAPPNAAANPMTTDRTT